MMQHSKRSTSSSLIAQMRQFVDNFIARTKDDEDDLALREIEEAAPVLRPRGAYKYKF